MKLIPAIVPICALLLSGAIRAATFEGKLAMTMTFPDSKNGPQSMNFSMKDSFMRTDVSTPRGTQSMIFDGKNQQMIILIPQMQKYMVQPMPQGHPAAGQYAGVGAPPSSVSNNSGSSFKDTGTKETILGYDCEKYLVTTPKETAEMWLTDQLGSFMGFYHGGGPGGRGAPAADWESALKGRNFFPMRIVMKNAKGTTKMEVTSVEKASLPDSVFAPPEGWQKIDLGGMMGGFMPGGRPPSGNN